MADQVRESPPRGRVQRGRHVVAAAAPQQQLPGLLPLAVALQAVHDLHIVGTRK